MPLRFNLKTKFILLRLLPLIKNVSLVLQPTPDTGLKRTGVG